MTPEPPLTPELRPTIPAWAVMTPERTAHVHRVALLISQWAEAIGVPDSDPEWVWPERELTYSVIASADSPRARAARAWRRMVT